MCNQVTAVKQSVHLVIFVFVLSVIGDLHTTSWCLRFFVQHLRFHHSEDENFHGAPPTQIEVGFFFLSCFLILTLATTLTQ